jgi:hypothetical protein
MRLFAAGTGALLFTVRATDHYLTNNGSDSSKQFRPVRMRALSATESTEDNSGFQQLWSLFHLDARSDPALAGLDMDQLRQLYNSGEGGQPMNADYNLHRIFLFADDKVLSDPTASIIKCVDADYRAEDYVPRNKRMGGQRYFGWMRMRAGSVAELWVCLDLFEMSTIAPLTIGGSHLVVWDGDH